ncbi:hypothetical protein D9756_005564 [Leucocoprinus leucothites]|uniref:Sld7 C-terminal domain-containing protein n=1 Tax=Leucocoprinus leucothites TaxID=201217 RepID=A0A8H5D7R9_9AGAR|nr:hypothetical protein D9756_005564 [Leucoagaricus leucothites]
MVPATSTTALTPRKTTKTCSTTPKSLSQDQTCRTPSSSSVTANYRLLYRGALSLPDSYLLLDGLTFSARLESPMKHHLLENPLALALESMRGRQSLRFLGTVKLSDVWLDESGNVEMDIHPRATLSKIYFENIFCLLPYPPASTSQLQDTHLPQGTRSELGVKIALGDADGPDTTHIIVFGQVTSPNTRSIKLQVARTAPHPPLRPIKSRVPRPDDPTPRRPPAALSRTKSTGAGVLKRTASSSSSALALRLGSEEVVSVKKQKLATGNKDQSKALTDDKVFKVPHLPGKKTSKGDVSGQGQDAEETEVERANKNFIKKATLEHLCKTKDPTLQRPVDKTHPEFKEIWGSIYRGVGFALRAHMKMTLLEIHHVLPLIETHSRMYVGGSQDGLTTNTLSRL